ncbi:TetR/AcrR family transcriptional regulator [Sphingomonas floccifaciens]|uniref:TetR/AcrR family transcriptional regulator n=1 Tax=Sphingomonas floccifaciens TaxID=1844115 RepID=A0ABW4NCC6_9SPHN
MSPPTAYERKKDPEGVRAAIIDAAMAVLADKGLARLTIDGVASAAGVTKGGLFHHFPTKDALIDGVLESMTAFAEASIEAEMAQDPEPYGRFTRAYLNGVFVKHCIRDSVSSHALCLSMIADPTLQDRWAAWVDGQVRRHAATDDNVPCRIVRLAADGIWLSTMRSAAGVADVSPDVRGAMIAMTRASP